MLLQFTSTRIRIFLKTEFFFLLNCFRPSTRKRLNDGNTIASLMEHARCIIKSSLGHSSGTTIWSTKLCHDAVVLPGLTQNLRVVARR